MVLEHTLDREVQPSHQITVCASDQGTPRPLFSLVNVTITVLDVNDNPPVFERRDQMATVPEDVRVGTEVLRVYAASKDIGTNAEITYSIRSGNEHRKFHIHPLTGEWRCSDPVPQPIKVNQFFELLWIAVTAKYQTFCSAECERTSADTALGSSSVCV